MSNFENVESAASLAMAGMGDNDWRQQQNMLGKSEMGIRNGMFNGDEDDDIMSQGSDIYATNKEVSHKSRV